MIYSPLIDQLISALRCLPGVGPKSAQRMAFHLIERDPQGAIKLAQVLETAVKEVKNCLRCRNLSETSICHICNNNKRNQQLLCIVETPADVVAIEQTHHFQGLYFVLMGHLSPLDGIGPNNIGMDKLLERLQTEEIQELILATNPTVEGEATAHYIATLAKPFQIKISRIAYGVPFGGDLEYVDSSTLSKALEGRGQFVRE